MACLNSLYVQNMYCRLVLWLVVVCCPLSGTSHGCFEKKDDVECPKCQPIRPVRDFDEEKVNCY